MSVLNQTCQLYMWRYHFHFLSDPKNGITDNECIPDIGINRYPYLYFMPCGCFEFLDFDSKPPDSFSIFGPILFVFIHSKSQYFCFKGHRCRIDLHPLHTGEQRGIVHLETVAFFGEIYRMSVLQPDNSSEEKKGC